MAKTNGALKKVAARAAKLDGLVSGPAVAVTRDPAAEMKIHAQVVAGLYALSFAASFTKTEVDDRLVARAIQKLSDPKFWGELSDDIWGPPA